MKRAPELRTLIGIISIVAALTSVVAVIIAFIKIQPSPISITVPLAGSIVGAVIGTMVSAVIALFSDKRLTAKVFISYSKKDVDFVRKLTKDLAQNGFQVITCDSAVLVGDDIEEKVVTSIENTDFFISVLSKEDSNSSRILNELKTAYDKKKKIFPVLKDKEEEVNIPSLIKPIRYADFTTDYNSAISMLIKSLKANSRVSKKQLAN